MTPATFCNLHRRRLTPMDRDDAEAIDRAVDIAVD